MGPDLNEPFILLGVGLAIIALRLYARTNMSGLSSVSTDDYLMVLASLLYITETILAYMVGARWHGLANNGMSDEARAALSVDSEEYTLRINGSKTQVAGWCVYSTLLWTLKASCCAYYLRLTDGLSSYKLRIQIGFGLIGATWVALIFAILLGCQPFSKNWQISPNPGNLCQPAISNINVFVVLVTNVATDAYLLSIPIPLLWSVKIKTWKKMGLMALFSGGIFITVAGILRGILIVTNPVTGAQQAGQWAVRETFVAVICTNAPVISPLLRKWLTPIFGTMLSSKSRSGTHTVLQGSGIRLPDKPQGWRSGNSKSTNMKKTMLDDTGSEEYIVQGGIKKNVEVTVERTHASDSRQDAYGHDRDSLESFTRAQSVKTPSSKV